MEDTVKQAETQPSVSDSHEELVEAYKFLSSNAASTRQDKQRLKEITAQYTNLSLHGLTSDLIKELCTNVIFQDHYDISTRRRLLYACVPHSRDFPYKVIPVAVSTATLPTISSTWQASILTWIAGLLNYHIINDSHVMVHICYPSLFNMVGSLNLCPVVCRILCQISRRDDVTPHRTQVLFRLKNKYGFKEHISNLIRIFQSFRPDLIVTQPYYLQRLPRFPKLLEEALFNARQRLSDKDDFDFVQLWPEGRANKKFAAFGRTSALPQPEIFVYAETVEEKKEKKISVLQYKRVKEMIEHMHQWSSWNWPNSAPSLLWKPITIALFRPYDINVKVGITNWLELALRMDVIEQWGNPSEERKENLLDACLLLVKETETLVPAVYHFLIEFLAKWDGYSHMSHVLEFISFAPFISPTPFFERILESISHLMTTVSLPLFCAFIDAFANTCVTWALQAHRQGTKRTATDWGHELTEWYPLEGIYFLSQRLARISTGGIFRFGPQPLLLNTCISYYNKVNMCCENLDLPLLIFPCFELSFSVIVSADLVSIHRFGKMLATVQNTVKRIKDCDVTGDEKLMRAVSLWAVETINFTVLVYLDSTVSWKAFSDRWNDVFPNFVSSSLLDAMRSLENSTSCLNVARALPYLAFNMPFIAENKRYLENSEQRKRVITNILEEMEKSNLQGVISCAKFFIR